MPVIRARFRSAIGAGGYLAFDCVDDPGDAAAVARAEVALAPFGHLTLTGRRELAPQRVREVTRRARGPRRDERVVAIGRMELLRVHLVKDDRRPRRDGLEQRGARPGHVYVGLAEHLGDVA